MSGERLQLGIIGAGAVATAMARALGDDAYVAVWSRRPEAAERLVRALPETVVAIHELAKIARRDVVLIAVSDDAITDVAEALARVSVRPGTVVLHTSGLRTGASALAPLARDAIVGSLHPLIAIARDAGDPRRLFDRMPFAVEASDPRGEAVGADLVARLGGELIALPPGDIERTKARYHAFATLVATGVVTLVDRAAASLADVDHAGTDAVSRDVLRAAYAKLAESAARNVLHGAGADVLTGALARGDEHTIDAHHEALSGDPLEALYREVERAARRMLDGDNLAP